MESNNSCGLLPARCLELKGKQLLLMQLELSANEPTCSSEHQ
jgi:hypothetical protein